MLLHANSLTAQGVNAVFGPGWGLHLGTSMYSSVCWLAFPSPSAHPSLLCSASADVLASRQLTAMRSSPRLELAKLARPASKVYVYVYVYVSVSVSVCVWIVVMQPMDHLQ
mmetsp:Transcript_20773/g.45034  ORF Transcript_20773/g.45034 Transcript_20773/m.45034 type:complete len:111 (-) Transcript_20773:96-428(-)